MRQRRTLKSLLYRKNRVEYIHRAGLVVSADNLQNQSSVSVLEIHFPLQGVEFWLLEGSVEDIQFIHLTDTRFEVIKDAKLIMSEDDKPLRKRKFIEEVGLKIIHFRARW